MLAEGVTKSGQPSYGYKAIPTPSAGEQIGCFGQGGWISPSHQVCLRFHLSQLVGILQSIA